MSVQDAVVFYGGELSSDIAHRLQGVLSSLLKDVKLISMSDRGFKSLSEKSGTTLAIFVVQTIENESPPEEAGPCVRFFKRKTHPENLLNCQFAVLGLGDSNLLLDRQHTSAKDCNQVAQLLDLRLEAIGGRRFCDRGEADERTGLTEVEPWIEKLTARVGAATS